MFALTWGDPFSPGTWGGSTRQFLLALQRQGALADAANLRPRAVEYAEKAASYSRDPIRWRQRYFAGSSVASPVLRRVMGRVAARRAALDPAPPVALQLTNWVKLPAGARDRFALTCAYLDSCVALYRRRTDLVLDPDDRQLRRTLEFERGVYEQLDVVFTFSDWLRDSIIADYGQPAEKVVTVWAGANLDRTPEPPARDFSSPRLLFVGRNFVRKGGPDLVAAFRRVREQHPDTELWIVGPEDLELDEPGVSTLGRISRAAPGGEEEIERIYRQATAFVMPSIYEGFGIPFLEAMAYGLPCVGTDCCAIPELVQEGLTGYLAPPGDVDRLASRLLDLVGDPARSEAMGRRGYELFRERFSWDRVAERVLDDLGLRLAARANVS